MRRARFEGYLYRGMALSRQGNHRNAIRDFDLALERNPESGLAYLERGKSYYALDQFRRSILDIEEARKRGVE